MPLDLLRARPTPVEPPLLRVAPLTEQLAVATGVPVRQERGYRQTDGQDHANEKPQLSTHAIECRPALRDDGWLKNRGAPDGDGKRRPPTILDEMDSTVSRIQRFLSERPLASFLIAAAAILITADAGRQVASDKNPQMSLLSWAALGLMLFAVIQTAVLLRFVPSENRLSVRWGIAIAPHVFGQSAVMTGSPLFLIWIGTLLSLGLAAWAALSTARRRIL